MASRPTEPEPPLGGATVKRLSQMSLTYLIQIGSYTINPLTNIPLPFLQGRDNSQSPMRDLTLEPNAIRAGQIAILLKLIDLRG